MLHRRWKPDDSEYVADTTSDVNTRAVSGESSKREKNIPELTLLDQRRPLKRMVGAHWLPGHKKCQGY